MSILFTYLYDDHDQVHYKSDAAPLQLKYWNNLRINGQQQ